MSIPHVVYLPFDISPALLEERFGAKSIGWQGGYDEDYDKWMRWGIYSVTDEHFSALIGEMEAYHIPYKTRE